jgi:hypothetical protein
MKLIEKVKRWWAPGEYDDERPSEGEGFAESDRDYEAEAEKPAADLVERGSKH